MNPKRQFAYSDHLARSVYGVFLAVLLHFLLSSCAAPPSGVGTGVGQPAPSPTNPIMPPASTHTPSPQLAATLTTAPTQTATLTEAPPEATPHLPATLVAASQPEILQSLPSPDGERRAEVARWECAQIGGEELAYEELRLVLIQDGSEQILATQLQNCGGLGAFGLGVVSWASDSRTLYYTQAREGVPDGLCWYWYPELFALAIESGQKTQLRQGPLSPDGSILAFWEDNDLVLWSLDRGEIARRPAAFPDLRPGPIAWAPDGQALAYIQNRSDCHPFGISILVRLDLAAYQETVLLQSETPSFTGVDWKTPNRLDLRDADRNLWWFNSYTQELTLVETPQPPP